MAESFDSRGWKMLGERRVNGRTDHDRIDLGTYEGKLKELAMVVLDSDIELIDFSVKFQRGADYKPRLKHKFREGERAKIIYLPSQDQKVKSIELRYRNLPGGGDAKVQIWAR